MAKTVNRIPNQVNYPTTKSVKDYFFNHYEWKGINDDKNFLEVDQKTFQKAENVYIDSEGLLRSRPAIKKSDTKLFNNSLDNPTVIGTLENVIDFWKFGDIVVYYCHDITIGITTYDYVLIFTMAEEHVRGEGIVVKALSEDLSTLSADFSDTYDEIKVIMAKNKIFVFTYFSISYYDMDTFAYYNSDNVDYVNPIYVPTTKVITSTTTTDLESPNILTNKQIYKYIYSSVTGVNIDIYGKEVSFKIGDEEYTVTFTEDTRNVIAQLYFNIDMNYAGTFPNVTVSVNGVIAMFSVSTRYLALTYDNGKTFEYYLLSANAGDIYGNVKFSSAGDLVYLCTATGIWVLSVYATTSSGAKKYPEFYNLTADYSIPHSFFSNAQTLLVVDIIQEGEIAMCYVTMSGNYDMYFIDTSESSPIKHFSGSGLSGNNFTHWRHNCKYYNNIDCSYIYNGNTVTTERLFIVNTTVDILLIRVNWSDISQSCIQKLVLRNNGVYVDGPGAGTAAIFGNIVRIAKDYSGIDTTFFAAYTISSVSLASGNNIFTTNISPTNTKVMPSTNYRKYFTAYNIIVCEQGIYNIANDTIQNFINVDNAFVIAVTPGIYYTNSSFFGSGTQSVQFALYSTNVTTHIEMQYTTVTEYDEHDQPILYNFIVPTHYTELHNFYFAVDNLLMVSADRLDDDKNWCWYFPENQQQKLNYYITALHPINDSIVAAFMEDEVWYIVYNSDAGAYTYQKSKLQLGLPDGNNVITSLDGTTILFVTKRGLVGLGYQDFIASTEQALSYLSDSIFQIFNDWNTEPIRLHLHGFWLICYKQSADDCYIYDIRNKSWWHCNYPNHNATKFVTDGTELIYLSNEKLYDFDRSDNDYHDNDGDTKYIIDWEIASQKLYLDAANYYKHIVNITLNISIDENASNSQAAPTMNLQICNYRKVRNIVDTENFSYEVDMIRTFVKRLNYFKVCEFQYDLRCDTDNYLQVPLSLADITVKYKIAGEVR